MKKLGSLNRLPHVEVYTRIGRSEKHGVGVIAIRRIKKGVSIFPDDNSQIVWIPKNKLARLPKAVKKLYDDFCIVQNKGQLYGCPKSFNRLTVAWYLNHSNTPNVRCDRSYRFIALRDIQPGEELTADYRTYNDFSPVPPYLR